MKRGVFVTVLSVCLLAMLVESAVIRIWRDKSSRANAKVGRDPDGQKEGGDGLSGQSGLFNGRGGHRRYQLSKAGGGGGGGKGKRKGFRPTHSRCCKIGEKMAKRKLSCDVQVLEVIRKYNDMLRAKLKYNRPRKIVHSNISAKLSNKLQKCSVSFPKYFEKCCKYREQFYKSMAKCKKRQGKERRQCRQSVRRSYKSPGGGGKRGGGGKKQRKPRHRSKKAKKQQ